MSTAGLALFVFFAFLVPVPLLHWLDRIPPPTPPQGEGEGDV